MTTETKPEKTDGKAPAGESSGESAPEKKVQQQPGAEGSSGAEKGTDARDKEKGKTFFQKRQERKASLEERLNQLQEQMSKLVESRESTKQDRRESILDSEDPDAFLDNRFDSLKRDIEEVKSFKSALENERKLGLKYQADEYLLSRKHSDDPEFCEEIRTRLLADPSLAAMSEFDPMRAAKAAYIEACEARGITPDLAAKSPAGRAGGPKPTRVSSPEKTERSHAEWQAYVRESTDMDERERRRQEWKKANSQGRITK